MADALPSASATMTKPPPIGTMRPEVRESRQAEAAPPLQNLHYPRSHGAAPGAQLIPGLPVRARGASWRVHGVDSHAGCQIVTLTPLRDAPDRVTPLALIVPFDRIAPLLGTIRWRACGIARVSMAVAAAIRNAAAGGAGNLLGPDLALAPWQCGRHHPATWRHERSAPG